MKLSTFRGQWNERAWTMLQNWFSLNVTVKEKCTIASHSIGMLQLHGCTMLENIRIQLCRRFVSAHKKKLAFRYRMCHTPIPNCLMHMSMRWPFERNKSLPSTAIYLDSNRIFMGFDDCDEKSHCFSSSFRCHFVGYSANLIVYTVITVGLQSRLKQDRIMVAVMRFV